MVDAYGRTINYLRLSVTDKCNLRCRYCMPRKGVPTLSHKEILTLEETLFVVRVLSKLGIKKVRLTGGEPLVRKNLVWLIREIAALPGIEEVALTTNGLLFAEQARALRDAHLAAVNFSLDTTRPEVFASLTGVDALPEVLRGIREAVELGFRVKINCVPLRGVNDTELFSLASFAKEEPLDVRFIELMPLGCGKLLSGLSTSEVVGLLAKNDDFASMRNGKLASQAFRNFVGREDASSASADGPAVYVKPEGYLGRVGFISPLSHKFCLSCNRIRLTMDGALKTCLQYEAGLYLRDALRGGVTEEELEAMLIREVFAKPREHSFAGALSGETGIAERREMFRIGG